MIGRKLRGILNVLEAFIIPMIVAMYGMGAGYLLRSMEIKGTLKLEQAFLKEIRGIITLAPQQISYTKHGRSDKMIMEIFYNMTTAREVDYSARREETLGFFRRICMYHYHYRNEEFCKSFNTYIKMMG